MSFLFQFRRHVARSVKNTMNFQRSADGVVHDQVSAAHREKKHRLFRQIPAEMPQVRFLGQALAGTINLCFQSISR